MKTFALREYRSRTRLSSEAIEERKGKLLTDADRVMRVEGPARYLDHTGQPAFIYLPGALEGIMDEAYPILTTIRAATENRGLASATEARTPQGKHMRGKPVSSAIVGSFEDSGYYKHCRLTSWTRKELTERWPQLFPLFQACAKIFEIHQPDRYARQMEHVRRTQPDWVIPGTPFTTVTINNTYPTGMHLDDGDLDEGFSCLAVARRGNYTGGILTLPELGLGVDLQDGDFVLMNAHRWHGNTKMVCECGNDLGHSEGHKGTKPCETCGAERISVVLYFRTAMTSCGTYEDEMQKAVERAERVGSTPEPLPT